MIDAAGEVTELQDCGLIEMPEWAIESEELLPKVKILWLDRNRFAELPQELAKCVQLDKLNMYNNKLTRLVRGPLPRSLRILELNHNQLTDLGADVFSHLPHLRHLDLCANLLTTEAINASDLPAAKKTLRFVDISSNRLRALPSALAELHCAEVRAALNPLGTIGSKAISAHRLERISLARAQRKMAVLPPEQLCLLSSREQEQ